MTGRSALVRHPLAIAGALIATLAAVVFIALLIAGLLGMFANPYAGLVVFVAIPLLFVAGLILIPIGMRLQRRKLQQHPSDAAADWPVLDFRQPRVRRTTLAIAALTAVNVVIVLLAGYGSLHWMESPSFCGQACHTPMEPQFGAWQAGVHRRVACVDCHIGEGARAFVRAKLAGVRQLVHVTTGGYPRPIPPGADMPPGAQAGTCIGCHDPTRIGGDRIRVIRDYSDDETNSETTTVLQMRVGTVSSEGRAIHWHADPNVTVDYVATDEARETIPYVKVTNARGEVKEFRLPDATDQAIAGGTSRRMDCIDCHNTIGHRVAPTVEGAVNAALAAGALDAKLPFVRREAVRVLAAEYPTQADAEAAIDRELRAFYKTASADGAALESAIGALRAVYRHNVFPAMKVKWGTYPDNIGHMTSSGCFRCHDGRTSKDGKEISADCEFCHIQPS